MRIAAAICFLWMTSAFGYELRRDSSGEIVRWAGLINFTVDEQLPVRLGDGATFTAIDQTLGSFDGLSDNLALGFRTGTNLQMGYDSSGGARNESAIVALSSWPFDDNAIAVTVVTVNTRTHQVLDADIAFNTQSRSFRVLAAATGGSPYDDIQNTLTHELGHAVGLAHNPELSASVMFPSASRGEITKRHMTADDVDGILALYPDSADGSSAAELATLPAGCSAAPGKALWAWPALALFAVLAFRRRRPALLLLLVPAMASAEPTLAASSEIAASGEVVSARAVELGSSLFWTELEVRLDQCHHGDCPERIRVRMPGGKRGELEQVVEGLHVPEAGESIGVVVGARPRVFRLAQPQELSAFRTSVLGGSADTSL